ncbi:hypothetical protein [Massilia sp. TWP1-3-3]|uniref:hypothetical protein n=1 Tax=Massilia sp. TWP1-3-3 TaxID=2804573 RepID=UPI003CEB883B
MKNKAKHFYGQVALVACIAASSAAAVGQSAVRPDPSDPGATVAPNQYESFLPKKNATAPDRSPPDTWKEANRTVGSFDAMSLTMTVTHPDDAGPTRANPAPPVAVTQSDPHAGPSTPASDPHAAHRRPTKAAPQVPMTPAVKPPDLHAGHETANKPADLHAGHVRPDTGERDSHAGHVMPPSAPGSHAGNAVPAAVPDPHAGHAVKEKK